eukprot:UN26490
MLELISKSLFYICIFAHAINYSQWIKLKTYETWREKYLHLIWRAHAPMTFFVLFVCRTESWWKYMLGTILTWTLNDGGSSFTTWQERPILLFWVALHHMSPILVLIYQAILKITFLMLFYFLGLVYSCVFGF